MTIFIRCVYRCVELSGGFFGELFVDDEPLFMVLEGVMIILAALGLTVFHPGWVFGQGMLTPDPIPIMLPARAPTQEGLVANGVPAGVEGPD